MTRVTVSEARATLPAILDRVAAGEELTITRHGDEVAVMIRPDALRARRSDRAFEGAQRVSEILVAGARSPLPAQVGLTEERAEELIADVRAGRDGR